MTDFALLLIIFLAVSAIILHLEIVLEEKVKHLGEQFETEKNLFDALKEIQNVREENIDLIKRLIKFNDDNLDKTNKLIARNEHILALSKFIKTITPKLSDQELRELRVIMQDSPIGKK